MDEMPLVEGFHKCDGLEVHIKTQGHNINEVVEAFECALRGAGYCFNGHFKDGARAKSQHEAKLYTTKELIKKYLSAAFEKGREAR